VKTRPEYRCNANDFVFERAAVVLLAVGFVGFCIHRRFRKRRTKDGKKGKGVVDLKAVQLLGSAYKEKVRALVRIKYTSFFHCALRSRVVFGHGHGHDLARHFGRVAYIHTYIVLSFTREAFHYNFPGNTVLSVQFMRFDPT